MSQVLHTPVGALCLSRSAVHRVGYEMKEYTRGSQSEQVFVYIANVPKQNEIANEDLASPSDSGHFCLIFSLTGESKSHVKSHKEQVYVFPFYY